jgi:Uma2 family endonuclease
MRLLLWADHQGGWKVFGGSTGFCLLDSSVPSPDLVAELASPSDEGPRALAALRSKMAAYQANGARLGWLLIPHQQAAEIWAG